MHHRKYHRPREILHTNVKLKYFNYQDSLVSLEVNRKYDFICSAKGKLKLLYKSQDHTLSFSLPATGQLIGSSAASWVPRRPLAVDTVVVELEMALDGLAAPWVPPERFFNFSKYALWAKSRYNSLSLEIFM